MQSTWEEAHSVALREYLHKGMPFSEIARALNQRFGTSYSRNAAIGRARRMGLSVPVQPHSASVMSTAKKPDARRIRELRTRKLAHVPPKPSTVERAAALQLRCVAVTPRHLALVDLEANDCRYPYGGDAEGDPITFCGHPRHEGASYCLSHFHLTRLPLPREPRRRCGWWRRHERRGRFHARAAEAASAAAARCTFGGIVAV
jgi:GcrA cell cycle regulator